MCGGVSVLVLCWETAAWGSAEGCGLFLCGGFWGEYLVFRSCPGEAGALLRAPSTGSAPSQASPRLWRVLQVSEVGYKVRLGAFVGRRNVYLTSSKATNKYKKLIGKVLTGS